MGRIGSPFRNWVLINPGFFHGTSSRSYVRLPLRQISFQALDWYKKEFTNGSITVGCPIQYSRRLSD